MQTFLTILFLFIAYIGTLKTPKNDNLSSTRNNFTATQSLSDSLKQKLWKLWKSWNHSKCKIIIEGIYKTYSEHKCST